MQAWQRPLAGTLCLEASVGFMEHATSMIRLSSCSTFVEQLYTSHSEFSCENKIVLHCRPWMLRSEIGNPNEGVWLQYACLKGIQLLVCMKAEASFQVVLCTYDEVQLLATDCQTDSRVIGAFAPAPTEASDFNVTRGRKKTQNLWPGCSNRSAKLAPVRPPAATKVPNFRAGARPFE